MLRLTKTTIKASPENVQVQGLMKNLQKAWRGICFSYFFVFIVTS